MDDLERLTARLAILIEIGTTVRLLLQLIMVRLHCKRTLTRDTSKVEQSDVVKCLYWPELLRNRYLFGHFYFKSIYLFDPIGSC